MSSIFILANIAVFIIGLVMVHKHNKGGWNTPPVLSGIAFMLIALPGLLSLVGI